MPDSRAAIKTNGIPVVGLTPEQKTTAPTSPANGQLWTDTSGTALVKYYNGSSWIDPRARANHSGTQTASTVSDFDTQVRTSRLDQMAAPTANVSMGSHKVTSVTDPTSAQDAATKNYVDTFTATYAHDENNTRTINTTGSFQNYTGQPSITVTVPASGKVLCEYGFTGFNNNSDSATTRVAVDVSGANTSAADLGASATTTGNKDNTGAAINPLRSAHRCKLYTGLSTGSTTFKMQARISSGSSSTCAIADSYLLVQPLP